MPVDVSALRYLNANQIVSEENTIENATEEISSYYIYIYILTSPLVELKPHPPLFASSKSSPSARSTREGIANLFEGSRIFSKPLLETYFRRRFSIEMYSPHASKISKCSVTSSTSEDLFRHLRSKNCFRNAFSE